MQPSYKKLGNGIKYNKQLVSAGLCACHCVAPVDGITPQQQVHALSKCHRERTGFKDSFRSLQQHLPCLANEWQTGGGLQTDALFF